MIVPAWLLVPADLQQPAPAVITVHGHGAGVDDTVGLDPQGAPHADPDDYHQNFALTLCKQGFVVIAPELRGFGRRREARDQAESPGTNSCHAAAWWGIMLGKPLLGSRVWDTLRMIDVLQALPEVDGQRIGIMGGSGGGTVALFAAALEQRLQGVVLSNSFCTFKDSILAVQHCHCNYVPAILQDAETYDIAALIAPRPLLVASGTDDPIFPLPGVLEAYGRVRGAYNLFGAADRLTQDIFVGGHQMKGQKAFDFLRAWLARST